MITTVLTFAAGYATGMIVTLALWFALWKRSQTPEKGIQPK